MKKSITDKISELVNPHRAKCAAGIAYTLSTMKRNWVDSLSDGLLDLARVESNPIDIEAVCRNERFVSSVLRISDFAMATRDPNKLRALRNAALNIARAPDQDEYERETLIQILDRMTAAHIEVLREFVKWTQRYEELKTMPQASEFALLLANTELTGLLARDLVEWYLIRRPWAHHASDADAVWTNIHGQIGLSNITIGRLGQKLMHLISAPIGLVSEGQRNQLSVGYE